MTTSLLATAQPGSSGHSIAGISGTGLRGRPAEIEFRDLRYFAAVMEEVSFT